MGKMRVHELAKELGLENRALLDILAKKKVEARKISLHGTLVCQVLKAIAKHCV